MALPFIQNISYQGRRPNFERDMFETVEEMKNFSDNYLPEVFITTCVETGKLYIYNKSNEIDEITGKWREIAGQCNPKLSSDVVSSYDVGGVGKEVGFSAGTSLEDVIKTILEGTELKVYFGTSDTKEISSIVGFESGNAAVEVSSSNKYVVFAADSKFGDLIIKDSYGFDNTSDFTKSTHTIGTVDYNFYVSNYKITCSDFQYNIYTKI